MFIFTRLRASLFFLCIQLFSSQLIGLELPAIYLTWQKDPATTMTIQWLTPQDSKDTLIEYQKVTAADLDKPSLDKPSEKPEEWLKAEGKCQPLPDSAPYNMHVIELQGLSANCLYRFKVKEVEEEYRFRTMPKDLSEPVRFVVGGDVYPESLTTFEETAKQAAQHNPRFVLLGGDLAYSVSDKRQRKDDFNRWLTLLSSWTRTMKDQSGCMIPLIVAIGNHEVLGYYDQTPQEAKFFYALFAMPGPQGYNILRFGNYLSLALLDSGHTHSIGGEQKEWLARELRAQPDILHRFCIYHVPAFPSVRYFRIHQSSSIRRHWVPLFEQYGIHAVFENHDHAYKRTHPLLDGSKDPDGVVYFGDGSWGVEPRIPKRASRTTYLAKTQSTRQFLQVDLTKKERTFQAITPKGEVIDRYVQPVVYSLADSATAG